jgi:hypothetical protein
MPALPSVPSTIRVALSGTDSGNSDVATRFYMTYTGSAPSVAQLDTWCTAIGTAWNTDMASHAPNTFTLTGVEAIDLTSPTSAVGSQTVSHAGTETGTALPLQDALVISYTIARRYRGGHPRGYWRQGVTSDLTNERTWGSTFLGAMAGDIANFFSAVGTTPWSGAGTVGQTNISYYEGFTVVTSPSGRARNVPKLRAGGPVIDAVTGYVCRANVGTQRRRIQFQG